MSSEKLVECSFYIPQRRDAILSDGGMHDVGTYLWLEDEIYIRFQGATIDVGLRRGFYQDPDTGEKVEDLSRKYTVAISAKKLDDLRELLRDACAMFAQKCIYLSIRGKVEFVGPSR